MIDNTKIIENLEKRLSTFSANPKTQNVGIVEKNTHVVDFCMLCAFKVW